MWPRPPFWRIGPYSSREPDSAYWVIVVGGVTAVLVLVGSAVYVWWSAWEEERERSHTGGFWTAIGLAEMCTGSAALVLVVFLLLYAVRHRPLD